MTIKRSIIVQGRKTSVSVEDPFWRGFRALARRRRITHADLADEIDRGRSGNLSSAIRLAVLADTEARLAAALVITTPAPAQPGAAP